MAEPEERMGLPTLNAFRMGQRAASFTLGVSYFAFRDMAQSISDFLRLKDQETEIGRIKEQIKGLTLYNQGLMYKAKELTLPELEAELLSTIESYYKSAMDNWVVGTWSGVGTAFASAIEQFTGAGDLLWAYKHLAHRIGITPRMARHWMREFRPTVPDTDMAFTLMKREQISLDKFKEYASYDGWDDTLITQLLKTLETTPTERIAFRLYTRGAIDEDAYKKYVKAALWPDEFADYFKTLFEWWPSAEESFFMWCKGIIDIATRNKYYKGHGYPEELHEKITANFYYPLSLYDMIRLYDYNEVDLIWATKKLKERGLKETDIVKILDYLKYRPLREEVRNLSNQLVWRYTYGRITLTELTTELDKLPLGTTEKSLLRDYAEMRYEDELINEQMEILKWRFRMSWITDEDYLNGLLDLGIREEKANLIVETEKAQGYFGYY